MAAREDDSSRNGGVEAFLASCALSGDDAYGAARAVLERLQAPATRAEARRLLGAVRRRLADDPAAGQEERFRAFNLRIHDVVLQEFIECLDPGIPVPGGGGARPIPGCHPLVVDTPEPAKKSAAPWRGSHGPENHSGAGVLASPKVIRTIALNFKKRTPVKEQPSPARSSASVRKSTTVMPRLVTRSRILVAHRGDPVPPPNKIPKSMYPPENSSMSCTASRMTRRRSREEESFVYSWKTGL